MSRGLPGRRGRLALCFAIVYLVWGSTYLVTAVGVRAMPPFLFGAMRFLVGGALLLGVARSLRSFRSPQSRAEWHGEWRHILLVGAMAVLVSNGCNAWGLQYVPSNQGALLNATVAFWVTLFGLFGARAHRPDRRAWTGLALGLGGTALILLPRAPTGATPPSPWGPLIPELVILLGCMGWSLGTVLQRNTRSGFDLLSFTALQQLAGGLMLLAIGIGAGELSDLWQWSAEALWAMLFLAVVSSCIAYTAYAWLTQNATPSQVGTYALVNPAIATLLGWIALDEALVATQWVGMTVILVGVLLVNWPGTTRLRGAAE
jgi:drug/metabolite transporter (DMT)-like permease